MESSNVASDPGEEFKDLERRQLTTRILRALKQSEEATDRSLGVRQITSPSWFALWLSDISCLRNITRQFEDNAGVALIQYNSNIHCLVTYWLPNSGIVQNFPSTSPVVGSPLGYTREANVTDQSSDRDRVCVLIKCTDPLNSCHILPFSLAKSKADSNDDKFSVFQSMLEMFWSQEKVNGWVHGNHKILDSVTNRITMAPQCHEYWDKALFALRPVTVNEEKTLMVLQFFWLQGQNLPPTGSSLLLPETIPDDFIIEPIIIMPNDLKRGGRDCHSSMQKLNLTLYDCERDTVLCSGDYITISTDDPETLPLPDEQFLSLQWTLHRLAALCAAVGYTPLQDEDDFDSPVETPEEWIEEDYVWRSREF